MEKCRGREKAQSAMAAKMLEAGYKGGKVRIHHAENPETAQAVRRRCWKSFRRQTLRSALPGPLQLLCERGGVLAASRQRNFFSPLAHRDVPYIER